MLARRSGASPRGLVARLPPMFRRSDGLTLIGECARASTERDWAVLCPKIAADTLRSRRGDRINPRFGTVGPGCKALGLLA